MSEKLSMALQNAERVYSLAQEQDRPTLMIWAYNALAGTLFFLGDFESARKYAKRGVQTWRVPCSHQNRKGAEVDFARETLRSNLPGVPSPKSERTGRTWIPITSLLAHPAPYLTSP